MIKRIATLIGWGFAALVVFVAVEGFAQGFMEGYERDHAPRSVASIHAGAIAPTDPYWRASQCYYGMPLREREVYDKLSSTSTGILDGANSCQAEVNALAALANMRPDMRDEMLAQAIDNARAKHAKR